MEITKMYNVDKSRFVEPYEGGMYLELAELTALAYPYSRNIEIKSPIYRTDLEPEEGWRIRFEENFVIHKLYYLRADTAAIELMGVAALFRDRNK
jgi:hypothetical protein